MEVEEVKKITRYDEYTVNEFVRGLVKTRSDVVKANEELAVRAENIVLKVDELEVEMSEEELAKNEEELQNIKKDKKNVDKALSKWEKEKERIKARLENKKQENENKINENQEKIQNLENEIEANKEKMQDLDNESEEYAELEKANSEISKKISRAKGNITRYEKKINNLIEMIGNLEEENVLEGLKPPKEIKTKPRTLTLNEKYKAYIDKKARETGYYSQARTPEEDKNFRKMDELAKNLQQERKVEEPAKVQEKGEIASLEEQIKKSAERMKEYRDSGNFEQEAAEHVYYNGLVSRINELKSKETEVKQPAQAKQQAGIVKTQPVQARQQAETIKTQPVQAKQQAETIKTQPVQAKQQAGTVKTQPAQAKQQAGTVKTQPVQAKQTAAAVKTKPEQVKETNEPKPEVKWNSKLTQDQIEELIAEGIEPGDNEYNLYLWNHGINPFEDQIKQKQSEKKAADPVLEKYENDGFGKNAFGWYFNPWKDEFDKDYDPHNDPEYNNALGVDSKEIENTIDNEEKNKKVSLFQRLKNGIKKLIEKAKHYIDNFNNKQLPEGTENEQEKEEYIAKANEILKETISTDRVFDAKSRAAMQERNQFVAGIHISKELREKIDAKEEVNEEMSEKEEAER